MTATMTAAVLTAHGGPEALQVRDDVAVPEPAAGQVLVAVTAAAVNHTDLWSRQGAYGTAHDPDAVAGWRGEPLRLPRIQGGDVAGRIVDTGERVDPARVGQRVLVVIAGAAAGAVVTFDLRVLSLHQRRLVGSSMHTPAHFRALVARARGGGLSPRVAATYPLGRIHEAQHDFAEGDYVGKLVLRPPGSPSR